MKKCSKFLLLLLFLLCLTGCNSGDDEAGTVYEIYTVNKEETKVESYSYTTDTKSSQKLLQELLAELSKVPEDTATRAAIMENVVLEDYSINGSQLTLWFSPTYSQMSLTGEVLSRAAIVRTLCQLNDVEYVSVMVGGAELTNASGVAVGLMNAEQFVENNGSEINSYERTELSLYFTDETGVGLTLCTQEITYNSNISMEKLVVESLIAGPPKDSGLKATLNKDTKLLSVIVKDGTCYVNFDSSFKTAVEGVSAETTIYSIVNSLTELTSANKVQISIDGETDITYQEAIPLVNSFERNYEMVE